MILVVALLPTIVGPFVNQAAAQPRQHSGRIVGYYTGWSVYDRKFEVAQIRAAKLTHINYAFANISPKGECVLGDPWADVQKAYVGDRTTDAIKGNFGQLARLKRKHPHLKTLISIGGWTWSGRFSDVALTPKSRQHFAGSCVAFMKRYGFDGIDIDWEYPVSGGKVGIRNRPEDKQNLTLLLADLRQQLDTQGKQDRRHYLLTIAAPASPEKSVNLEVAGLAKHLDWINVMAYDYNGAWSERTGFNASLHSSSNDNRLNCAATIQAYLRAGAPRDKLVLGVPFYGRGWKGVAPEQNGLHQPHQGAAKGSWESGSIDYKDLQKNYVGQFTRHWHAKAKAPWLYDATRKTMVSYDDVESITDKAQFVNKQRLGGIMIWELSQDTTDEQSLLNAIHKANGREAANRN